MQVHELALKSQAEADAMKAKVTSKNFSSMATQSSVNPTKRRGGNLGKITKERLSKPIWEALKSAQKGDIVGPFQVNANWELFLRGQFTPATQKSFESVQEGIVQKLIAQRRKTVVEELTAKAKALWPVKVLGANPDTVKEDSAVLFTYGKSEFTKGQLERALRFVDQRQAFQFKRPGGKEKFLDLMVERTLIAGLAKTSAEFLARHGEYLKDIERQLIINEYAKENVYSNIKILPEAIRDRYNKERDSRFKAPASKSIKARHILFSLGKDAPASTVETVKQKAVSALARIQGGESFAKVASEVSEGPTKSKGGDLGTFGPGRMVPPFDKAVQALQSWEVTKEFVRTRFGFHLIQREPASKYLSFTEVRAGLTKQMQGEARNKAIQDLVAKLRLSLPVESFPSRLPTRRDPEVKTPASPPLVVGKDGKVSDSGKAKSFTIKDGKITPVEKK